MVAFGIAPDRPETGYGYIRTGEPIAGGNRVDRFVEKPDRATAERFLAEGGHAWNGGIFAFRAGAFMDELETHRPAMAEAVRKAVAGGRYVGQEFHPAPDPFADISGESVDYAVMENTERAAVVPADMGWSDIGNWEALRDARPGDDAGNRTSGEVERFYFKSLYFREPNGVLFEIATDGPGFTADEPLETLGEKLSLPPFLEGQRSAIEAGAFENFAAATRAGWARGDLPPR